MDSTLPCYLFGWLKTTLYWCVYMTSKCFIHVTQIFLQTTNKLPFAVKLGSLLKGFVTQTYNTRFSIKYIRKQFWRTFMKFDGAVWSLGIYNKRPKDLSKIHLAALPPPAAAGAATRSGNPVEHCGDVNINPSKKGIKCLFLDNSRNIWIIFMHIFHMWINIHVELTTCNLRNMKYALV